MKPFRLHDDLHSAMRFDRLPWGSGQKRSIMNDDVELMFQGREIKQRKGHKAENCLNAWSLWSDHRTVTVELSAGYQACLLIVERFLARHDSTSQTHSGSFTL